MLTLPMLPYTPRWTQPTASTAYRRVRRAAVRLLGLVAPPPEEPAAMRGLARVLFLKTRDRWAGLLRFGACTMA
jgi:hypothetical protein